MISLKPDTASNNRSFSVKPNSTLHTFSFYFKLSEDLGIQLNPSLMKLYLHYIRLEWKSWHNGCFMNLGAGRVFPCSSHRAAPAAAAQRRCWVSREARAVVGVSVAAPPAFFRGENSSSLTTSNATKFLPKDRWNILKMNCTDTLLWFNATSCRVKQQMIIAKDQI